MPEISESTLFVMHFDVIWKQNGDLMTSNTKHTCSILCLLRIYNHLTVLLGQKNSSRIIMLPLFLIFPQTNDNIITHIKTQVVSWGKEVWSGVWSNVTCTTVHHVQVIMKLIGSYFYSWFLLMLINFCSPSLFQNCNPAK